MTSLNPTSSSGVSQQHQVSAESNVEKRKLKSQAESSVAPKEVEQPVDDRSFAGRCINAVAGTGVMNIPLVRNALKRFVISSTDFDAVIASNQAELKKIVGDARLFLLLKSFAPTIVKKIESSVGESYPNIASTLKKEDGYLESVMVALLLKAAVNIGTKAKLQLNGPTVSGDITADILKYVLGLANGKLAGVDPEEFRKIEKMKEGLPKTLAFRALFSPAAEDLLRVAFPNGKDDLGLHDGKGTRFATVIWETLSKEVFPDFLVSGYRLMHQPNHHTAQDLEVLEKQKGGAALKAIAKVAAEKGRDLIPEVLGNSSQNIAKEVLEKFGTSHKKGLEKWLGEKIKAVVTSDSDEVKGLWDSVEKNIESIMIHALASIAKTEENENAVFVVVGTGFKIIDTFLTKNQEKIDAALEKCSGFTPEERTKEVAKLFKPLVDEVLKQAALEENEIVDIVRDEALPALFLEFYEDMKKHRNALPSEKARLKDQLLDSKALLKRDETEQVEGLKTVVEAPEKAKELLWKISGVDQVVEELSGACGILAQDVVKAVKGFALDDQGAIAKSLNEGLFAKNKLSAEEEKELADGLNQFFVSDEERMDKTWKYTESLIEGTIFKIFVKIAETNPVAKEAGQSAENKNKAMLGNVVHRVLSFLVQKIPLIDAELQAIKTNDALSEDEKKQKSIELFKPLVSEFLSLAGDNIEEVIPVPEAMKAVVFEKVKEVFLPATFYEIYTQINGWRDRADESEAALQNLSPNAPTAVNKIADYINDFIPYYMETNPTKIAELITGSSNKYLAVLSPENKKELTSLIGKNIETLGQSDEVKATAKAIGNYSKAVMLKLFAGLSTRINEKESIKDEKGENHFLLLTVIGFITTTDSHVMRINKIPPQGRMSPAHNVPNSEMLNGFKDINNIAGGDVLHGALDVDLDPNATAEQKKEQRLKMFFRPLAQKLIAVTGIDDPENFPVPESLRADFWKVFSEDMLPEVLYNLYDEMMKPHNVNMVMLKVVDALSEVVDDIDAPQAPIVSDPEQKKLDEALGNLIIQMIDLVPDIWTKTIFKFDKIRKMSAESVGQIVRQKLDKTTLNALMDQLFAGMALSKPDADRYKTDKEIALERSALEKELKKKLTAYISVQVKETGRALIKSKWNELQESFDRGVKKCLGNPGLAVKQFLDKIFHFIFIDLLCPILDFIVFKVLWFFVDLMIARKSEEIIKDLQMPIHESLLYRITDDLFESLIDGPRPLKIVKDEVQAEKIADSDEEKDELYKGLGDFDDLSLIKGLGDFDDLSLIKGLGDIDDLSLIAEKRMSAFSGEGFEPFLVRV